MTECDFCGSHRLDLEEGRCLSLQMANMCDIFTETQVTIGRWQKRIFPNVSLYSSVVRMLQEAHELVGLFWIDRDHALQHPQMPHKAKIANEIADVYITLVGVAERAGVNIEQAVNDKMEINRKRKWTISNDGTGQHMREVD